MELGYSCFNSIFFPQTHQAMEIGRTGRVQVEDIIFLVRKDPRKYARVRDLLTMNEELKKARKAFDEVKYGGIRNWAGTG
ncbi:unnamed protein product [Nesidiocoris tenuis]|uniref:Transcription initiation factor TFIID subunit 13 n=1 Tax=Nesidiocoris tenuis TaxID=355587 RepID=A0A6H5HGL7_9HEMI|nr:unnamed protein product [Nesidiocoris tenuis]